MLNEPAVLERFRAFYEEHFARVYNYLYLRLGDHAAAEDVAAEAFRKALASFDAYRADKASPTTWIFAIARNALVDHVRRWRWRRFVGLEFLENRDGGEMLPQDHAEREEALGRLASALDGLAAREREIIALKFGLGRNNREIASELGLGESHVGTLLHRSLRKMKLALGSGEGIHGR